MAAMRGQITPGKLALWALAVLGLWIVYVFVVNIAGLPPGATANWIAWIVFVVVAILLVMAGVSKAVQIGVRTGRD